MFEGRNGSVSARRRQFVGLAMLDDTQVRSTIGLGKSFPSRHSSTRAA